jgi:1-deoxy-D-xylulose-5-phosphate reductoisomerase
MRKISIFGATGSIGESAFDLISRQGGPLAYETVALTGGYNVVRLAQMAVELRAKCVVTAFDACLPELRGALNSYGARAQSIKASAGAQALIEAADQPCDWALSAIIGAAGLAPGFHVLRHGGTLALANKESLVTAGPLFMAESAKYGATLLPVDSEHSAIFQTLVGEDIATVERIILTASGGALRDWPYERLKAATLADTQAHPNWSMGQRITVDSASMFNKAMEIIETKEFFNVKPAQIEVILHPESIIHSMVAYQDGAVMAHLGAPDMRHAIGYALHYPMREKLPVPRLDFVALSQLNFKAPDLTRYPALRLAHEVMHQSGTFGAAFNAAKDVALDGFIAGQLGFMDMAPLVEETLSTLVRSNSLKNAPLSLDDVAQSDHLAKVTARALAPKFS